ncbi:unnamed protein product [Effrenium voratum]|nr:unnamed protein product [Effrenium voratum]
MSWLLQNVRDWDYFINLNDSDYPIAQLTSLRRFLWLNNGGNFINVGSAYKDCDCGRYLVFECGDELYSIAPGTQYPRRPQLQHASGPNLVAITRDFADYIDGNRNVSGTPVQQVLADLGILQQPDEKFFQTMSLNSPYCPWHVRWGFHIWDRPGLAPDAASPEVAGPELKMLTPPLLSSGFWERLAGVKRQVMAVFFARKFDNNRTEALQDQIDEALEGRTAAFGIAGSWTSWHSEFLGFRWLQAMLLALAGVSEGASHLIAAEVWRAGLDATFFDVQRYRGRIQLPCAGLAITARSCKLSGRVALEELAARPAPAAESGPSLLGALRVGVGWDVASFAFDAVSVLLLEQLGEVDLVMYWTHAALRSFEELSQPEMEVRWHRPDLRSESVRAVGAAQLVTWHQCADGEEIFRRA